MGDSAVRRVDAGVAPVQRGAPARPGQPRRRNRRGVCEEFAASPARQEVCDQPETDGSYPGEPVNYALTRFYLDRVAGGDRDNSHPGGDVASRAFTRQSARAENPVRLANETACAWLSSFRRRSPGQTAALSVFDRGL